MHLFDGTPNDTNQKQNNNNPPVIQCIAVFPLANVVNKVYSFFLYRITIIDLSMRLQRILLIIVGWFSIILAILGILLPLLPTTPFLLLAAWCFSRSSPRFHYWLLHNSWFGKYIRHWQQHKALPKGVKIKIIVIILFSFIFSLWFVESWWIRGTLLIILAILLAYLLRLPQIDGGKN